MLSTGWSRLSSTLSSGNRHHSQSLPFFTILQNAAGRAWSRRVAGNSFHYSTAHDQTIDNGIAGYESLIESSAADPSTGTPTCSAKPIRTKARARVSREKTKLSSFYYPHPDSLTEDDVRFSDAGRCTDACSQSIISDYDDELGTVCVWGDPLLAQHSLRSPPQSHTRSRTLPQATSRAILYRNLTLLSCRIPPVTLPQLMDYHDLYPETQSTRSYNFLISMAIRTTSFGSVQWLLQSMAAANINKNLETHKLVIRWKIRMGAWEAAWQTLTAPGVVSNVQNRNDDNASVGWPESLWSEFFGSLKRRSIRRKGVVMEEPDDPFIVYAQRFLFLMKNRPSFSLTHAKPRIIHSIAYILLQLQQQEEALQLVRTYFSNLPSRIAPETTGHCLDIIHILIVFGSRERGLKKFHEHREILNSLVTLHSSFVPTSTTLFLLLGSLRRAMRSGVLASECLASFKRRWGKDIEDHRVRLRVASLALKQGRLDISSDMLADGRLANEQGSSSIEPAVVYEHSTRRPRFKSIFRGTGKLVVHQIRLEKRVRRAKERRGTIKGVRIRNAS
ncbi:hypothetical protein DFJ43DRAFT_100783 [Lentinula guzmanii]|uniref:Uncharacterized protein n=1 Tax=Lentinula guzmanii TaxID=2804957 RepID=A0AA38JPR6_9AGAR|nr:hypothetical protein DFJ43DRAFT_100783 [Lentinula guzmanii]